MTSRAEMEKSIRSLYVARVHGDLDGGASPAVLLMDGLDEQRPAILKVGDHHHADDAGEQLMPTVCCHCWQLKPSLAPRGLRPLNRGKTE